MKNVVHRLIVVALLALAVPLFASSPEYQVGATAPAAAPYLRNSPAIGTDGTDFFAVWYDGRSPGRGAIIGTRIKRSGQILDPLGIRISSAPAYMWWPTAVWDGDAWVVAWTQNYDVYVARVDRDGHIVTAPRVIAEGAMTTSGRYAESNGSVTVIAYRVFSSSHSLPQFVVLDRAGNTIRKEALALTVPAFNGALSVAASPSRFIVTWGTAQDTIWAAALGSDGRIVRPAKEIGIGQDPIVATDGTGFVAVSRRWFRDEYQWALMSRTLDADLTSVGDVQPLASEEVIESVSLLWRGDRYEVIAGHKAAGASPYGLLSIELDRDGQKIASRRRGDINLTWAAPTPSAATNGSDVAVAYTDNVGDLTSIVGRVYRGSSPLPDVHQLLSWSGNAHSKPDIASSASGHLAAWTEEDGVFATRIDANGKSLDGRGLLLANRASGARAAFDGTNYVVAWVDLSSIHVRYIAPATGATVAEVELPVVNWWQGVALAVSADATYVAFNDGRIRVTRIPHATRTPGEPVAVSPEDLDVSEFAMAWNGTALLVVWNEFFIGRGDPPYASAIQIHAARVTAGLALLDPAPLLVASKYDGGSYGIPSVASNGDDWLIVSTQGADVIARRVSSGGNLDGTAPAKLAAGFAGDVTWTGTQYAIAYHADTDPAAYGEEPLVLAAVAAPSGELQLTRRAYVSREVVGTPSVASTPNGDVSIIYTKVSFRPEHTGVERSYFRVMDFGGRGRVVRR